MRGSTAVVAALGTLVGVGCGPAPYTLGAEEPVRASQVAEPSPVTIVVGQAAAPAAPAPSREPEDRWFPDGFPRPNPFAERRTWVGAYDCPQGRTELTLRVVDVHDKFVRAIFDFHHAPTDVAGQFLLAGAFDEQTGNVRFVPGVWIVHPDDYVTVGMAGRVSRDGTRFEGSIPAPGCGGFWLHPAR